MGVGKDRVMVGGRGDGMMRRIWKEIKGKGVGHETEGETDGGRDGRTSLRRWGERERRKDIRKGGRNK